MKEFQYTIQDPMGFHARPAGALVRAAKAYTSKITISCGEKSAQLTRLMAVMGLGIKRARPSPSPSTAPTRTGVWRSCDAVPRKRLEDAPGRFCSVPFPGPCRRKNRLSRARRRPPSGRQSPRRRNSCALKAHSGRPWTRSARSIKRPERSLVRRTRKFSPSTSSWPRTKNFTDLVSEAIGGRRGGIRGCPAGGGAVRGHVFRHGRRLYA